MPLLETFELKSTVGTFVLCTTSSDIGYMSGYGGPGSCSRAQQWEMGRKTRKKATHNVLSLSFPFLPLVPTTTNHIYILWLHFCCPFVTADHLLGKRVFSLFLDFFTLKIIKVQCKTWNRLLCLELWYVVMLLNLFYNSQFCLLVNVKFGVKQFI